MTWPRLSPMVLAVGFLGLFGTPALAGVFSVTPVHIVMTPRDRAVAVTISNESDEELVMQADLYLWKQKPDGQEDLTLTEDMFLSPPIIKLAPRTQQVVRLARLVAVKSAEELTYRLIVREIPEARPSTETLRVQIALAISLPVFITPPKAKPNLNCTVDKAGDKVRAVCENTGTATARPTAFVLNSSSGERLAGEENGGYILSHIKRSFDLQRTPTKLAAGKATLVVSHPNGTSQSFDVSIPE